MPIVSLNSVSPEVTAEIAAEIAALSAAFEEYLAQTDPAATGPLLGAAAKLAARLPGYDTEAHTMPWDRDEEMFYADAGELGGWLDAGVEAVYRVYRLHWAGPTIGGICSPVVTASDALSSLVDWHPDYDHDTGQIVPGPSSSSTT